MSLRSMLEGLKDNRLIQLCHSTLTPDVALLFQYAFQCTGIKCHMTQLTRIFVLRALPPTGDAKVLEEKGKANKQQTHRRSDRQRQTN